jgi:hypothetical protein
MDRWSTCLRITRQHYARLLGWSKRDLDAAQHLLHEIVICAFRREHGRDPATRAEYRAYHRAQYEEAVAAMAARTEAPAWLTSDDE